MLTFLRELLALAAALLPVFMPHLMSTLAISQGSRPPLEVARVVGTEMGERPIPEPPKGP